jgi:hypothetical protein
MFGAPAGDDSESKEVDEAVVSRGRGRGVPMTRETWAYGW